MQSKYNKNANVFPGGYVTTDDSWLNLWTAGADATLGWNGMASGNGARAFGKMLTQTDAFPKCMAKRVFNLVCLRDPTSDEQSTIDRAAADFAANGRFNMKDLFATIATLPQCMGN